MNPLTTEPPRTVPADDDLEQQARQGQGIPSQDPSPAAQFALDPQDAKREAASALVGGGLVAGSAAGAAIGVMVAGPVGVLIGASLGAAAGAMGGAVAGGMGGADSVTLGAVRLHIEDSGGNGRPVVLIHGWPLSTKAWEPQVAVLQAAGFRVVAYDRRGFGRSDKPESSYSYDVLADDLQRVLEQCDLHDATLVGFSMGGGEVARYVARHGQARLRSVVFAAAVPPYLMKSADNPEGPLTPEKAQEKQASFQQDRDAYFEKFTSDFFSANGVLQVSESQRSEALALCHQSAPHAALACMESFATTDFRADLAKLTVPTLVIHGDADAVVPIEGSGSRTHHAVAHSQWVQVAGAPHGLNVSHAPQFNAALLAFLRA